MVCLSTFFVAFRKCYAGEWISPWQSGGEFRMAPFPLYALLGMFLFCVRACPRKPCRCFCHIPGQFSFFTLYSSGCPVELPYLPPFIRAGEAFVARRRLMIVVRLFEMRFGRGLSCGCSCSGFYPPTTCSLHFPRSKIRRTFSVSAATRVNRKKDFVAGRGLDPALQGSKAWFSSVRDQCTSPY